MSDDNALVRQENKPTTFAGFPIEQMSQIKEFAQILLKSKLMPPAIDTAEKAIILVLKGHDLGLTYMQSIESINVIQGKPAISASLIQAKIRRSGVCEYLTVKEMSDKKCIIETKRTDEKEPFIYEFGEADARAQNLLGKDNYKKQPKNMYFSRCMSAIGRYCYADVFFGGIYVPEELGANDNPETLHGKGITNTKENADFVVMPPETKTTATVEPVKATKKPAVRKTKAKEEELANAKEIVFDIEGEVASVKETLMQEIKENKGFTTEPAKIVNGQDTSLPFDMLTEEELAGVRATEVIDEPLDEPTEEPQEEVFDIDVMKIRWGVENLITTAIRDYQAENKTYSVDEERTQEQIDFKAYLSTSVFLADTERNGLVSYDPDTAQKMKEYTDRYIQIRQERCKLAKEEFLRLKSIREANATK